MFFLIKLISIIALALIVLANIYFYIMQWPLWGTIASVFGIGIITNISYGIIYLYLEKWGHSQGLPKHKSLWQTFVDGINESSSKKMSPRTGILRISGLKIALSILLIGNISTSSSEIITPLFKQISFGIICIMVISIIIDINSIKALIKKSLS